MAYTTLGNTGLRVSVAGLGCGGNSRLGQASGRSQAQSVAIVHQAIDLGVDFLDTAAAYGTEAIVGAALRGCARDKVVISTKALVQRGGEVFSADEVVASLDRSLRALATDHVDLFHLHAVPPAAYDAVVGRSADVILFGTGDPEHLERNVASILGPPLPCADVARLNDLFGTLEGVGLDLPIHGKP